MMLNKIVARWTKEGLMAWIPTFGFWIRVQGSGRDIAAKIRQHLEVQKNSKYGTGKDFSQKCSDALLLPILVQDRRDVPKNFFHAPVIDS